MSAPAVAGAVALWLQADPSLTVNDVRNVLQLTSRKDSFVNSGYSERWGAGKLDAYAGLRYVLRNGDVNSDGEVNITDVNIVIWIILGKDVDAAMVKRADINKDGEVNITDINLIIGFILKG